MKTVTNPADDLRREKLRIALTRQISRWGWRLMMQALQLLSLLFVRMLKIL